MQTCPWFPSWNPVKDPELLVLSTHKSARHNFQVVWKNPTDQDPKQSKWERAASQWAVWVQTAKQYCTTAGQPRWKSVHELWCEKANRRFSPGCVQGLRYCIGWQSPLQANNLQFLPVPCQNRLFLSAWKFEASFQTATDTCHCVRAGMAQSGIISSVLFSLYVHMPLSSRYIDLALYKDDMSITATSCQPALLIKYQETYLSNLERWLR